MLSIRMIQFNVIFAVYMYHYHLKCSQICPAPASPLFSAITQNCQISITLPIFLIQQIKMPIHRSLPLESWPSPLCSMSGCPPSCSSSSYSKPWVSADSWNWTIGITLLIFRDKKIHMPIFKSLRQAAQLVAPASTSDRSLWLDRPWIKWLKCT